MVAAGVPGTTEPGRLPVLFLSGPSPSLLLPPPRVCPFLSVSLPPSSLGWPELLRRACTVCRPHISCPRPLWFRSLSSSLVWPPVRGNRVQSRGWPGGRQTGGGREEEARRPTPFTPHSGTWKHKPHRPPLGSGGGGGLGGGGEPCAVCRRCWGPCPVVCALCSPHLLRPIVPSGSLSLSFLPLTPFSGLLACRFSDPRAPPLPSGCAWVVPAPVLITALFLIDLSYLGSVVETSLSSAQ